MKDDRYPLNWKMLARDLKEATGWVCAECGHKHEPDTGYMLIVHHKDGDPANCLKENLIVLCQRCHLARHPALRKVQQVRAREKFGQRVLWRVKGGD